MGFRPKNDMLNVSEEAGADADMSGMVLFVTCLQVRTRAVECMTALSLSGKQGSDADVAAKALDADCQRLMHGRFEV